MAEGLENIFYLGDDVSFTLATEAADAIRSEAIMDGTNPGEIVREALGLYVEHKKLLREGWDGPFYKRHESTNSWSSRLRAKLGFAEDETIRVKIERGTPEA